MLLIHAVTDPHSTYSHYLAEILRSEGFVDFAEADLSTLDPATTSAMISSSCRASAPPRPRRIYWPPTCGREDA